MKDSLLKKLIEYNKTCTPFHMPGHKRKFLSPSIPYNIDITEVDGFDNLHDMQGVLKETADLAKCIYNSVASYPLVNGSTCGVLAGIYSLTRENKNILIARNCHKSVYNATEILDLNAHYIQPEARELGIWGEVLASDVEESIITHNIGTVVVTSPTYEGIISDVSAIYDVCKRYGVYLFIDCAHGAHMKELHKECDICVMSLHKTLPSLTQTAVLNIHSNRVDLSLVRHALSIFETSSPSYILLASIDECLRYFLNSESDFDALYKNLDDFYEEMRSLKNIKVLHFDDPTKILMACADGYRLAQKLREEKIETEMVLGRYALAMATVADTKASLDILKDALFKIDKNLSQKVFDDEIKFSLPKKELSIKDALNSKGEFLDFSDCSGKISLEYIFSYPPGAPIVVPGEVVSRETIEYLDTKKDLKTTRGKFPKIYVR